MLLLFLAFTIISHSILHTHALNGTHCNPHGVSPSPAPSILHTNNEHAQLARGLYAAGGTTARHPTSYLELPFGEAWDLGSENTEGDLLTRQSRCDNPSYIPLCQGPRPCCPPSNTVCCVAQGICCPTGSICGPTGTKICCPQGGSLCTDTCCDPGTTCCGGTECCASSEICDVARGRCYDPVLSSLSAASSASRTSANATPSSSPPDSDPGDEAPEIELTLEPSDSEIQYDPPSAWSETGGTCTNGTRTTTQLEAKITLKLYGTEVSVSFVPKEDTVSVAVELNGVSIDLFDIPGQSSSQCQLHNSWNRTLPSSTSEQEVAFIYKGSSDLHSGKRATPALELGEIRYRTGLGSASNHAIRKTATPAFVIAASIAAVLLTIF